MSFNQLTELPSEIGQLSNLETFYLQSNQLIELPPEIGQLTNLQSLSLSYNQLTELPSEMGLLKNLWELDLTRNYLTRLTFSIPPSLIYLFLDDNPLEFPPQEVIDAGIPTIAEYLDLSQKLCEISLTIIDWMR